MCDPTRSLLPAWFALVESEKDTFPLKLRLFCCRPPLLHETVPGQQGVATELLTRVLDRTRLDRVLLSNPSLQRNGERSTSFFPKLSQACLDSWDGDTLWDEVDEVRVETGSPFLLFKHEENPFLEKGGSVERVPHRVGKYLLCSIMNGTRGHFHTSLLASDGEWYLLDDGVEAKRIPPPSQAVASFFLYAKVPSPSLLPPLHSYPVLTGNVPNSCFINASVQLFRVIWKTEVADRE